MCTWARVLGCALALGAALHASAQERFPGIGRAATPEEVQAWDIDVRPDFQGLPRGSGSVAKGQEVWEAKCASCHGVFGESNEVFNPIVGGTTADDVRTGRVANLRRGDFPGRTTLMKLPTLSTLWDYINRAMPWNAPKSLTTEEVYAVTAYILNLGRIVPDDFVLSDANVREVQQRLPNRNGLTTAHALWPGAGKAPKPDVAATACMSDCPGAAKVTSMLPDHARNAHGNLAEQNRLVGPQRGIDTSRAGPAPSQAVLPAAATSAVRMPSDLLQKNTCTACHAPDRKLIGPSWSDVARRHQGKAEYIAGRIRSGGSGAWGPVPMPAQSIAPEEAARIAEWLASGAGR